MTYFDITINLIKHNKTEKLSSLIFHIHPDSKSGMWKHKTPQKNLRTVETTQLEKY